MSRQRTAVNDIAYKSLTFNLLCVVRRVRLLKNEKGECIAMKIVDLKKPNVDANDIRREMAIHKELKHKHILRLFGTREESTSNTVYMFLEFAEGGDLLNQIGKLKDAEAIGVKYHPSLLSDDE